MPNIKSAKKRLKQSIVQRQRNRSDKKAIHTECKKVIAAVQAGDVAQTETEFRSATRLIDKSAAKKVIHRNTAARRKSRLSAKVKSLKAK